jgi:hypothetical protein
MSFQRYKHLTLILALIFILATLPSTLLAQEATSMEPEQFILPWADGQSFFITWGPFDHWTAGKQIGLAADFALPEGTALYAPATGEASFLTDDRPYQYGLGNYVDLVCGPWKIRMAHLRDYASGTRDVKQGEFLGYSGSSGASAPHLHLELLFLRDSQWVAPQESDLSSFFGIPFVDLVEGAVATSVNPVHQLAWASEPTILTNTLALGQDTGFILPFMNLSGVPVQFNLVQVALVAPDGTTQLAQVAGDWVLPPTGFMSIEVRYTPEMSGLWRLRQVTAVNNSHTWQLPLDGQWNVVSSVIGVVGVAMSTTIELGQRVPMDLWLENRSDADQLYEHLMLIGNKPDGTAWQEEIEGPVLVPANQVICVHLLSPYTNDTGEWQITQLVEDKNQHYFILGTIERQFTVDGPRLAIDTLGLRANKLIYVTIRNVGTRSAKADWLEILGLSADGDNAVSARTSSVHSLAPGETTTLVLQVTETNPLVTWTLIAGGYWLEDNYYIMPLPDPYLYGTPG